jgi:phage/plasmid-associated DNA primase
MENFVRFTCASITTKLNDKGVEKKELKGLPKKWTENINKDNYKDYIFGGHKGTCVICGEINGITVVDFDNVSTYEKALEQFPDLKNYKTVKTKRGFHVYCKYNPNLKTRSNACVNLEGIDIANDGHMILAPPSYYIDLEGNKIVYTDLGGEILDVPQFIIDDLIQNQKVKPEKVKPEKVKTEKVKTEKVKKEKVKKEKVKKEFIIVDDEETESSVDDDDSEDETLQKTLEIQEDIKKLLDMIILDEKQKKDRTVWFSICSCIKYNLLPEEIWEKFYKDQKLNDDIEKKNLYKNLEAYPIEIYYLQSLAKKTNESAYNSWIENKNIYINALDIDDPYKTACTISKTLKNTLVLCKENWYMLNDKQLWKKQKEPSYYIITELKKYIDISNEKLVKKISKTKGVEKEKLVEISKIYLKSYKSISSPSYLNVLTKYLKTKLNDDTFAEKLDTNHGKLAFKNGIVDLQTKEFRKGILSSDFITDTIPYDYQKGIESKKEFLYNVLLKILNNNKEHLEYSLSIIGFTFIGSPNLEKSIYFCVDKTETSAGDNGKTFFFDILSTLLPNYVYKTKKNFLEKNNTKVHKQLALMNGKRLVWIDEFSKENVNAELIKELGDGNKTENEVMFGTSEIINILFKLFILTNHIPKIDPNDTAVYNRYKQISYGSHFDRTGERHEEDAKNLKFIADTSLGDKIKAEYYNEVFELIIEYANKYYTKKIPAIPIQFINDTKETQKENDTFGEWFYNNCKIDVNEKVALKAIVSQSGLSEKNVKDGMKRFGFKYNSELKGIGKNSAGGYYKGGYVGVKLLDIVEEEEK